MELNRRQFLRAAPALAGSAVAISCESARDAAADSSAWEDVRRQFNISADVVDFSALLIASHPRVVGEAIERHRRGLDENPTVYLQSEGDRLEAKALEAAARYLGGRPEDVALTDSTTAGLALVYHGFELRPDQEFLVSDRNYYSTLESVRLAAARTRSQVRRFPMYRDIHGVSTDELVESVRSAAGPKTRVLALTWVHSSTGLKIPVKQIAEAVAELNRDREMGDRVLLCVDGVHGFGVEDVEAANVGSDFFVAGCHKWLFGPRGTGIVWGSKEGWNAVSPTIPTFMDNSVRSAWITGKQPSGPTTGARMSPGGFKAFEHQWALAEAFEFHQGIGKSNIAARTHALCSQLKDGLSAMPHVTLYTPRSEDLSAGIVCFDVKGMAPGTVVEQLRRKRIVATTTPYSPSYARLTPSIRNSDADVEAALREIRALV